MSVQWPSKWDWDYLLHYLGGGGIGLVGITLPALKYDWGSGVVGGVGVWLTVVVGALGYVRERWQAGGARLGGRIHKWLEALLWPLGTATVVAGHLIFG